MNIINNFIVKYNNKLNEFIDFEKQILDILTIKLSLLSSEHSQEIEKTKTMIKNHQSNYLYLLDLKIHSLLYSYYPYMNISYNCKQYIKFNTSLCHNLLIKYKLHNYNYYVILINILNKGKKIEYDVDANSDEDKEEEEVKIKNEINELKIEDEEEQEIKIKNENNEFKSPISENENIGTTKKVFKTKKVQKR